MLLTKPLQQITVDDLQQLIDDRVQEGKIIEYKQAMYRVDPLTPKEQTPSAQKEKRQAEREKQIREMLKDVSSFANTIGGHLVVGMKEDNGVPTEICGVKVDDPDCKKLQLDELIQKWLEPRISYTTHFIELDSGNCVFIIRVQHSMTAPHRVTYQNFGHFFARNSGGAFRMDTSQLRTAFTLSDTMFDRMKAFRRERVEQVRHGKGPVPLPSAAKVILHLIPVESYATSLSLDIPGLQQQYTDFLAQPFGDWDWRHRFNMDGLVFYGGGHLSQSDALHERGAYSQIFRNGVLEVVQNGITYESGRTEKTRYVRIQTIESGLVEALPRYLKFYQQLGISPPVWCFLTLTDVEGACISAARDYEWHPAIERPDLFLPEILVDDLGVEVSTVLKPLYDMIWNSAGQPRSPYFKEQP